MAISTLDQWQELKEIHGSTAKLAFCAPGSICPHAQTAPGHSEFCGTAIHAIAREDYDWFLSMGYAPSGILPDIYGPGSHGVMLLKHVAPW